MTLISSFSSISCQESYKLVAPTPQNFQPHVLILFSRCGLLITQITQASSYNLSLELWSCAGSDRDWGYPCLYANSLRQDISFHRSWSISDNFLHNIQYIFFSGALRQLSLSVSNVSASEDSRKTLQHVILCENWYESYQRWHNNLLFYLFFASFTTQMYGNSSG